MARIARKLVRFWGFPIPGATGSLPVLQWGLPVPIHGDNAHAAAFDQTTARYLAQGDVAYPPVGQGIVVCAFGRSSWRKPTDGLADGPCTASHGGAGEPARRHGRDRRVLYRRSTEEEDRRAASRSWSQGPAQDNENPGVDRCAETQCRDDR